MNRHVNGRFVILLAATCAFSIIAVTQLSNRETQPDGDAAAVVVERVPARLRAAGVSPAKESKLRVLAHDSLYEPEEPMRIDELAAALASQDSNARFDAVSELGDFDDWQASTLLARVAAQDVEPIVRAEALRAIGDRRSGMLNPALMRALTDRDARVRKAAIGAIENAQSVDSLPTLALALQDSDASVRATAVDAIAELGGHGARRLIESVLADESTVVREAALEHLSQVR